MRKALAIAQVNLRRLLRDRTGSFFILVFPFLIILALGATFGSGFTPKLGVRSAGSGDLGADLVGRLQRLEGLEAIVYDDADALMTAVERGEVEGGLTIPEGFTDSVRGGATVPVEYLARPTGAGQDLRVVVVSAVADQAVEVIGARFAFDEGTVGSFDAGLERARHAAAETPSITVSEVEAGTGEEIGSAFDVIAAQELVLFMFITSLSASSMLIESRRLGLSVRMLATPTSGRTVLVGEAFGRYAIAVLQGALIVFGTLVLFRVDWGNPLTSVLIVLLFALVATGAAMLMGSVLQNAAQAGSLGVFLGLGLAALGGAMVPLEIFPPAMATIARVTPHAWAIDGLTESIARDASPIDVAPQLGVLLAYGSVLLVVAVALFRRTLTATPSP